MRVSHPVRSAGVGFRRATAVVAVAALFTGGLGLVTVSAGQQPTAVFRSASNLVRVDVIVRDRDGNPVRGLTAADFVVTEDNRPQAISSFTFEEIALDPAVSPTPVPGVLGRAELQSAAERGTITVAPSRPDGAAPAPPPAPASGQDAWAGRRLIVLLFDTSSMQPEEIGRAVDAATRYVDEQMTVADLVAVASVGQSLTILSDFTADRDRLRATLAAFDVTAGTGFEQPEAADTSDIAADADPADLPLDDSEFGIFNNDRRLRAMRVLADALAVIDQKKSILYFSSGMSRSGSDNQVELRAVVNAAVRSNTSIYPVDSRGLTAVVPGGAAGGGGRGGGGRSGGSSVFSGRAMLNQFASLNSSQETLTTLAADTGGEAFVDSNDFGPAFTRVQLDMSAYYLLGYSSTNTAQDGKFRRINVRLRTPQSGYRLEARSGYYAESDFAHLRQDDRERQLQEQIASAVSLTDLPVVASTSWFRVEDDRFYVPVSVAVPGSAIRVPVQPGTDARNATIDLLGVVTDEQGRAVGRIRDTMTIPAAQVAELAGRQVQYQAGVTLPAGRFRVKVAVRENADGTLGTFEFPITIPDLQEDPIKVSPVVLSTQLRFARGGGAGARGGGFGGRGGGVPSFESQRGGGRQSAAAGGLNPLLRGGQEIVQSLSHIVVRGQPMYFYFEVYDPTLDESGAPRVRASLSFYRGRVKVFETPVADRAAIDDPARKATVFQLQMAASDLAPGLYTCQVNVVDEIGGRFAFPRLAVYVKDSEPVVAPSTAVAE